MPTETAAAPDLTHMPSAELVALMKECVESADPTDQMFAKSCRDELARRNPRSSNMTPEMPWRIETIPGYRGAEPKHWAVHANGLRQPATAEQLAIWAHVEGLQAQLAEATRAAQGLREQLAEAKRAAVTVPSQPETSKPTTPNDAAKPQAAPKPKQGAKT